MLQFLKDKLKLLKSLFIHKNFINCYFMLKLTQAFIFCAGRGERMRPLTDSIPKPLVKINNKSILDYSLEKINKITSIKKIFINGFYLANQIEDHLKNLNNPKIIFSHEEEKIETKPEKTKIKKENTKKSSDDYKNLSIDKLKELLKDALDKEDYEKAAKIRDELGKRN
jgi:NDP-sugar pyrophosphorylase family protein